MTTTPPDSRNTTTETATVQISTLNVNGKSMTQGIFRQITQQQVINHAGRIDGTPWGRVNYHPDRCDDAPEHLHIVWQADDQLRRAHVSAPLHAFFQHRLAPQYAMVLIAEGATRGDPNSPLRVYSSPEEPGGAVARFNLRGVSFRAPLDRVFLRAWDRDSEADHLIKEIRMSYPETLNSSRQAAESLPTEEYKASWAALRELPQLFIGR